MKLLLKAGRGREERRVDEPDGATGRYPRHRFFPRNKSREGVDPTTGHDADIHAGALTDQRLQKALRPLPMTQQPVAPPQPHQAVEPPAPTPVQRPPAPAAIPGATFHYHPNFGSTSYGTHQAMQGQVPARINDHVAILPKGGAEHEDQVHARVIGHLEQGGIRIRHTATGREENLLGPQTGRQMSMAPGVAYGQALPNEVARAHRRDMSEEERALPGHTNPMDQAVEASRMGQGPQVGMRFREIMPHAVDAPHPFGDQHEIVHVYPSGHGLLLNRGNGEAGEMHSEDWHAALANRALRIEPSNSGDEHKDHKDYARMGALLRPEEYGHTGTEDNEVANSLANSGNAQLAGPVVRGLTDGAHGLQKLVDTYTARHGDMRSEVTHIEKNAEGGVQVRGKVHRADESGDEQHVGDFARTLHTDNKDNLVAHHDYLELPGKDQGAGFAQAFNDQAEHHYRDMGVHRIELHADITVGKYAWAQQGYDFSDKNHRKAVFTAFKAWADHHGHVYPRRDFEQHLKKGTAWDLANYDPAKEQIPVKTYNPNGARELHVDGEFHLGKAFLLSNASEGGWHGTKLMDPNSAHQAQAGKYREKQKSKGKLKSFDGQFLLKRRATTLVKAEPPKIARRGLPRRAMSRRGLEGRGPAPIQDSWYHGSWLLEHDPQVARGIYPRGQRLGTIAKSVVAQEPGEPRHIVEPGKRGGHWWYDRHGNVRYGERPDLDAHPARLGDHVLYGAAHARVSSLSGDERHLAVRFSGRDSTEHAVEPGSRMMAAMAPGTRYGNELPPALEEAHQFASASDRQDRLPRHANPRLQRERMRDDPQPGDRWVEWDGEKWGDDQEVLEADAGRDVVFHSVGQGEQIMAWRDWRKLMAHRDTRILPVARHAQGADDQQPPATATTPMHLEEPDEDPRDAKPAPQQPAPQRESASLTSMRHDMADQAFRGDGFAVQTPIDLHGNHWGAQRYDVTNVDGNGDIEVWDEDGNAIADLDADEWRALITHPAVRPLYRGDPQEEEEEFTDYDDYDDDYSAPKETPPPGLDDDALVGYVLPGVGKADVWAAWTNEDEEALPGGFYTQVRTMRAFTPDDGEEARNGFVLEGDMLDANGDYAGNFKRSVYLNDDGQVEVHHDLMMFGDFSANASSVSNTGFAAAFNERAEAHYRQWGVDCVTTYADISIGKYVWARQGFDFASPVRQRRTVEQMLAYAKAKGIDVPKEDADRLWQDCHSWDVAEYHPPGQPKVPVQAYRYSEPDERNDRYRDRWDHWSFLVDGEFTLGRAYLLDDHHIYDNAWDGIKYLKPGHPTYDQGQKYLAGKKAK